jgi:hypothetical protein
MTKRAELMDAHVRQGVKVVANPEHADLALPVTYDPPIAVGELVFTACDVISH